MSGEEELTSPAEQGSERPTFDALYARFFDDVVRWSSAMDARSSDLEDIAQEVFVVADRKLAAFDGQNPARWLYAITLHAVQNHRRLSWLRRLVLRRDDDASFDVPDPALDALTRLELGQLARVADRALAKMSAKHRRVFILFEVEGYSGEEIALLEDVAVATIWTRLHHARKAFVERTRHRRDLQP